MAKLISLGHEKRRYKMQQLKIADLLHIWPSAKLLGGDKLKQFKQLQTDSRSNLNDYVFVALKGERFDGHDYLEVAINKGAAAIVIDQSSKLDEQLFQLAKEHNCAILQVINTWQAFYDYAKYCREQYKQPVIAVTGSVGKTSSRSMISRALQAFGKVTETAYNLNNEVGISQTLFRLATEKTDYALIEMGIDQVGEMARETSLVQPDIAIITNIGFSHIDHFQSRQILLREKTSILNGLRPNGSLLLPFKDALLTEYAYFHKLQAHLHLYLYGLEQDLDEQLIKKFGSNCNWLIAKDRHFQQVAEQIQQTFTVELGNFHKGKWQLSQKVSCSLKTAALHHAQNACLALATSQALSLDLAKAAAALAEYVGANGRERIVKVADTVLLDDSYNAASSSFKAVLETGDILAKQYHINDILAVCGSINELGTYSESEHRKVGTYLAMHQLKRIYFLGHGAYYMQAAYLTKCEELGKMAAICKTYTDKATLEKDLLAELGENELLIFKGSHSFALGETVEKVFSELEYRARMKEYI